MDKTSRLDWKEVEKLFHASLALPAAERDGFLNRSCDDGKVREAVGRLLESAPEAVDFFDRPLLSPSLEMPLQVSQRVGPYRLIEELGRGGMGRVFLAERADDQFRKRVAVKVMGAATALSKESQRQFLRERQILANLEHPGIARLLDGGLLEGEVPYIVMEYVDGVPLDAHVSGAGMGIRQRLELFLQICEAVEYAHRNLVIHHDLKPPNILVTRDGRIKLLDFGVARLLDPETADPTVTWSGFRQVTPQYASPELLRGEQAGTASDVYSLGILLFELLTGQPPYSVEQLTPLEIEKKVYVETPPLCSELVRRRSRREGAGKRREATRLERILKGDLDNIVAQAIRKRPEHRYRSVRELAEDVRRYLDGKLVAARRHTWTYRASKFIRRHKGKVAAAALLAVALVGGIIATSWQALIALEERNRAEQSLQMLIDLVRISDPNSGLGADIPAREILEHAYGELQRRLPVDSEVRSEVTQAIGVIYFNMGLSAKAVPILEDAYQSRLLHYGPSEHRSLDSMKMLGKAIAKSDPDRAERLLQEMVRRRRASGETDRLAQDLHDLGEFYVRSVGFDGRRVELARPLLLEALEIRRGLHPEPDPQIAETLFILAHVMGDDRKEELLREALRMYRASVDEKDFRIASAMNDLALVLEETGKVDEALVWMEQAARLHEAVLGLEHPRTLTLINNLAGIHRDRGELDAAEPLYRKVLAVKERLGAERNVGYAYPLYGLGRVLTEKGETAEAESLLADAVEILSTSGNPVLYNIALSVLGECLFLQGRMREARAFVTESCQALEGYLEEGDPELLRARARLRRLPWQEQPTASLSASRTSDLG